MFLVNRNKTYFIIALLLVFGGVIIYYYNQKNVEESALPKPPFNQKEKDTFAKAQNHFMLWRERGTDFSSGPCLGEFQDKWVLDIVHFPRTADDDLPQNQCPEYLTGKAEHVVELNTNGDFVNMK